MIRYVRSGGSLNYACYKAEDWFKSASPKRQSLKELLERTTCAYAISEEICNILGCPLTQVIAQAHGRLTAEEPLLALHPNVSKRIEDHCVQIANDNTRWTTASRSKWGIRLLRLIATLDRTADLSLIEIITRSPDSDQKDRSATVDTSLPETDDSKGVPAIGDKPNEAKLKPDPAEIFHTALITAKAQAGSQDAIACLPHNFGIDLQGLRRITNVMLGTARQRYDVAHAFEAATPNFVQIDLATFRANLRPAVSSDPRFAIPDDSKNSTQASHSETTNDATRSNISISSQDSVDTVKQPANPEKEYKRAIASIKRKRITVLTTDHRSIYSYGILQRAEAAFVAGSSLMIFGISGTGKSTFISSLPTLGATVFEIGSSTKLIATDRKQFDWHQIDQMLREARRTRGRKVLICHEFFISRGLLNQFDIFDQFAFAGDGRQPGAGDTDHLLQFMKDIGGKAFTLPVVWRVGHPLSTMSTNYFAYGGQFKICQRHLSTDGGFQFDLIESDDSRFCIAEAMMAYALDRSKQNQSVIVLAACPDLIAAFKDIERAIQNHRSNIDLRHLADAQGREADVLVFDLHDIALAFPKPDEALRYVIMLLGRARMTTCILLGKRNTASTIEAALPVEVFIGVLLRYRVRSRGKSLVLSSGAQIAHFSQQYGLFQIDEQTIIVGLLTGESLGIALIKDRNSHNVKMLTGLMCMIEAPEFFLLDQNLEREIAIIAALARMLRIPNKEVNTFGQISSFIARRPNTSSMK